MVKNASLAARCHVFREAAVFLRSLIRRRSEQAVLAGVICTPNPDRCPSMPERADTESPSPKMACLEADYESWLVAAEALSKVDLSLIHI